MLGSRTPPHSNARVGCAGHLVMMAARKWCGDWYVGGGCRGLHIVRTTCRKNHLFFRRQSAEAEAGNTPRQRDRRHRACQKGSWEGGGSLVGAGDSIVPWGGDATCHDGVVQFTVFLVAVGQFLHPGGAKLPALVKVVIFVTRKGPPTHVIDATSAVQ